MVELREDEIAALISCGLLETDQRDNRGAIATALHAYLDRNPIPPMTRHGNTPRDRPAALAAGFEDNVDDFEGVRRLCNLIGLFQSFPLLRVASPRGMTVCHHSKSTPRGRLAGKGGANHHLTGLAKKSSRTLRDGSVWKPWRKRRAYGVPPTKPFPKTPDDCYFMLERRIL
jgi:hypothetical protein